jgi:hypothetical protein
MPTVIRTMAILTTVNNVYCQNDYLLAGEDTAED